jgi:two-component system, NarL family, response regulator DegU
MEKKIRVLLVDDHTIVLDGLKKLLESTGNISIVGEANNGERMIQLAKALNPDVIVSDISMPGINGLDAAIELKSQNPEHRFLMLSMHDSEEYIAKAFASGIDGFLLKNSEKEELFLAIKKIANGEKYYGNTASQRMMNSYLNRTQDKFTIDLTNREKEVLKYIVEGMKNKDIADKLFLSPRTVDTHRFNLMQKLNVKNTAELVRLSMEKKIL